jgi:hypothetical protein
MDDDTNGSIMFFQRDSGTEAPDASSDDIDLDGNHQRDSSLPGFTTYDFI